MDLPLVERNRSAPSMSQAPRPLQNRVDPFGELHAVAERGGMMGNRGGRLHRDDQTLSGSRWKNKHWLICVCEFKGRRRDVWGRYYTELFFLDEPTASRRRPSPMLRVPPAGRESLYRRFSRRSEPRGGDGRSAPSRAGREPAQTLVAGALGDLPDGAMIARDRATLRRALGRPFAVELRRLRRAGAA